MIGRREQVVGWLAVTTALGACTTITGVDELKFVPESQLDAGGDTSVVPDAGEGGVDGNPGDHSLVDADASVADACSGSISVLGAPCCKPGELACAGHAQKLVLVCSAKTNVWEALQSCGGQQLCDTTPGTNQGSCQEPVAACIGKKPGEKTCDGNNVIECGPDLLTSTQTKCPATCENGACAGSCTPNERQCNGTTPQVCTQLGAWQAEAPCTYVCTSAGNCTGECKPGDKQCNGLVPQTCDTSGAWVDGAACANICSAGSCSGACSPGSKECSNQVPRSCSALGQWEDGAPCAYVCAAGICGGECKPASKQCVGQIPQTCDASGTWISGSACAGVCSSGNCVAQCNNGDKDCSGKTPRTCVGGGWQNSPDCQFVCSGGVCTGSCVPGSTQCVGLVPQTCDGAGAWQSGTACPYLCTTGYCAGVCAPGDKRCNGALAQSCDSTAHWVDDQLCPYVCINDACTGQCVPGSMQCSGLVPQTCSTSGTWQSGTQCQYVCDSGKCSGECSPGSKACLGLAPQLCDSSGKWQTGASCPYVCSAGACAGVCSPGAQKCSGNVPQTCTTAGQWQDGSACTYVCSAGTCTGACSPGAKQCNGSTPQTCDNLGQWQGTTPCQYICSNGICSGVCAPGAKQCSGQVPQTCNASGQWQSGATCPYLCSAGSCSGVCTPGTKQCVGNVLQSCQASATWDAGTACPSPQICSVNKCVAPPNPPVLSGQPDQTSCAPVPVTLAWIPVTSPDADPVQYQVEVDDDPAFGSVNYSSGWISGASWGTTVDWSYLWYWRVQARDAVHPQAVSAWSAIDQFYIFACVSSCPLIFSQLGSSNTFAFETDVQGEVLDMTPGSFLAQSVPLFGPSYIVLNQLAPDGNGSLKVKLRESLPETSFADEVKLLAVDYPTGWEVASSSAESTYSFAYQKPFKLHTLHGARVPVAATDTLGNDVLANVTQIDDIPAPVRPYELEHYTFDFGAINDLANAKLVIDGWSAFGVMKGAPTVQPTIEVLDGTNQWVKVLSFSPPAGDLKTLVVEIPNIFLSASRLIRVQLGLRTTTSWSIDRIRLDESAPVAVQTTELGMAAASLLHGGATDLQNASFSHRMHVHDVSLPDDPKMLGYGAYTRYGDVSELLQTADDAFAIVRYGDRIDLDFQDAAPPGPGRSRIYVMKADIFYKGFRTTRQLLPMPFHGMSKYPYAAPEAYPTDPFHVDYRINYNTRVFFAP
jgi:hypothetical protein